MVELGDGVRQAQGGVWITVAPDIESSMVGGRFIMRDRQILTMDAEAIVREADAVGRRIWNRVEEANPVRVPRLERPS